MVSHNRCLSTSGSYCSDGAAGTATTRIEATCRGEGVNKRSNPLVMGGGAGGRREGMGDKLRDGQSSTFEDVLLFMIFIFYVQNFYGLKVSICRILTNCTVLWEKNSIIIAQSLAVTAKQICKQT